MTLLEISFNGEMRYTRGNEEMRLTLFHNSPYSRKYVLIRLTPYHWQPCVSQFCDVAKGIL